MADAHKNFAVSTVATAPSPATSGTSLVVAAAGGTLFPAVPFNAVIWPTGVQSLASNAEVVRVTNISTDTFTIARTQESSSARTVVVGDQIMAAVTNKTLTDAETTVLSYVEFTSNVSQTATTSATANTIVTAASVTVDGSTLICVEISAREAAAAGGNTLKVALWQDSASIGDVLGWSAGGGGPVYGRRYLTPSAGSYTYSARMYGSASGGIVIAQSGGAGNAMPGFIRVTSGT